MPRPVLLLAAVSILAFAQPADLILRNARIWTGNPKQPWADSLAASGDLITAVGDLSKVTRASNVRVIDGGGRLVTPGFVDSHVHLIEGGLRLNSIQLRTAKNKSEFIERFRKFAQGVPVGTWITGGDWDHEQWGGELPSRHWIDAVTPRHPVWVHRLDGHMALANSMALKIAGISRMTPETPGGSIVRDAQGEPTGVLKDNAMEAVSEKRPPPETGAVDRAIDAAFRYLLSFGVTSIHSMGAWEDLYAIERAQAQRRLLIRVYHAVQAASVHALRKRLAADGPGDRWLRIGAIKAFVDGSLGSHTAAFDKPYSDAPGDTGLLVNTPEQIHEYVNTAKAYSIQPAIHAIGDRANSLLLDVFERLGKVHGPGGHRWRIEHAQHLNPADIARMARLGVVASMQPYHAIDDGRWAERLIGPERARHTYAFRSLLDAKVLVAFGSDWFVAPPNVMEGIYAAVTRRTLDGKRPNGWVPEEKITVEEALRAYTWGGAYAALEEKDKGTLEPGKLADFVLLDRDITRIAPVQIRDVQVVMTVVGGKVAYERPVR